MELPKYNELYTPFLNVLLDGEIHTFKEIKVEIAKKLGLSEESLNQRIPSGKQSIYDNRVGWARTYLKKAGLIESSRRAHFSITVSGKHLCASGVEITNKLLAEKYPFFAEFIGVDRNENLDNSLIVENEETPQETLDRVYRSINDQLADELLSEIVNLSPAFFEQLVVDLMKAMGYGDGFVTKLSGDNGIDGVIHEDKLGFNLIYIQAKKWAPETTIAKPEIQKFAGAMMGPPRIEKGLFITTAKFSEGAKNFADAQHIILVDGLKLTELMIEYGLGVSTQKIYCIKKIDSDYFLAE